MINASIAVLAGTPVDTQMGVERLAEANLTGLAFPLSCDPWAQTAFQLAPTAEKRAHVRTVLQQAMGQGCKQALVYCNSLSATVDFPALSKELALPIVTPLDVYLTLAPQYQALGVIAANAQGLAGIERRLLAANPTLHLLGTCMLPVVLSIEAKEPPKTLVERHHLADLAAWFSDCGMEAMLLGCTHFPYFKEALEPISPLPLIDPAETMIQLLQV